MKLSLFKSGALALLATAILPLNLLALSGGVPNSVGIMTPSKPNNQFNANFDLVTIDDQRYGKFSLSPDLQFGPLLFAFDANLYLTSEDIPAELDYFTLRYVGMDIDEKYGFRVGRLRNTNFGQGLLVRNYDSGSLGSNELGFDKLGYLAYASFYDVGMKVMRTATKVNALRLTYTYNDSFILGAPIIFGGTYVNDEDGINALIDGTNISRPNAAAYSLDVSVPIAGDFLTSYVEYAQFSETGEGKGTVAGARGSIPGIIDYRAEFRVLGNGFAPGYFNSAYETTSFDFNTDTLQSRDSGFLFGLATRLMEEKAKVGASFETFEGHEGTLRAYARWNEIADTTGIVRYTKPFAADDQQVIEGIFTMHTQGLFDYTVSYKRVYFNAGDYTESYSVGTQVDLSALTMGEY